MTQMGIQHLQIRSDLGYSFLRSREWGCRNSQSPEVMNRLKDRGGALIQLAGSSLSQGIARSFDSVLGCLQNTVGTIGHG